MSPQPTQDQKGQMLLNPPAEIYHDPQALLEYAQWWMDSRYRGAALHQRRKEPTTGPWLTDLLLAALRRELEAK